jgi:HAE1 family hydrophobic/amphiphilic exporter-1
MKLPEIAVKRPVFIMMLFAAITLLGGVAFTELNLGLLPDIDPPAVSVITPYPGASATDVESEVTKHMEDQLSTTSNLVRLESVSKDNISIITCIFDWSADLGVAVNDIREKIDLARPDIAEGAKNPFIFKFSSSMAPVLVLTVTARESSPDLFRIIDKQIADPLKRVAGVGAILYEGGIERQINIHFDREALEAYNISVQQIRNVLASENLNVPVGTIKSGREELQVRVAGRYRSSEEMGATVIGSKGDAFIRLRDVAKISDTHEEPVQWGWGSGIPGMVLIIQKQSGANTVHVINAVKERLKTLKTEIPVDMEIHKVLDNSDHIYAMIRNLTNAAISGGVLVVMICFLFLRRLRPSLVVTMAIPFSIVAAFVGLFVMGYTINVISMMSLVIAAGMVVDNAIVVLENVVRHVDEGSPADQAAVNGASEVGMAVAASTLTTAAVFVPLLFVKGIAGIIFGQLAFVILITISASLFISLTLTPMACSRLLRAKNEVTPNPLFLLGEWLLAAIERFYAWSLERSLQHRVIALLCIIMTFLGSMGLVQLVGTEFLPEVDSAEIEIVVGLPEGTRGEVTAKTIEKILAIFQEVPEVEASYALAGQSKKGMLSALGFSEGTNRGRVGARLVPKEERTRSAKEVAASIRPQVQAIPEIETISVRAIGAIQKLFFGGGRPINIEVLGHDIEITDKIAEKIRGIVETTPGAADVSVSRKKPRPEIQVRLDRDKAASLGLNVALVADSLRTSYYGYDETKFREAGDDFDIELRLNQDQRENIREIGETPLATLTGQTVKLRNVAVIQQTFGPVEIERKNRVRVTRIMGGIQGRVLGDVVRDIKADLASIELPPGVEIEWGGEVEEQRKAFRDLVLLLILGIILVYMIMASQFENFIDPFVIMFSVPFAFVGVIWAFVLTATPLNLMSFIGVIMLMGIVVNNAIVLVDYVRQLRQRGMPLLEAIISGGRTRLRPVLMTSLTTIFGMLPLAFSKGEGSEVWNALGITVIGGLLVSGTVTLVLVPIIYSLVHSRKEREVHDAGS